MLPPGHWFWNLNYSYPITCACLRLLKCVRDHNSNNCTHSGNVCCCTYMVNNDYDKFRSFSRLYMTISASNLHIIFAWKSRQIFSFSLKIMARWQHSVTGLIINRLWYDHSRLIIQRLWSDHSHWLWSDRTHVRVPSGYLRLATGDH